MRYLMFMFLLGTSSLLFATTEPTDTLQLSAEEEEAYFLALYQAYLDSVATTLHYRTDTIALGDGLATLEVPAGFKYVGPEEAEMILTDIWSNPPSLTPSLGMLFPLEGGPDDLAGYGINIIYADDGHVDDEDAQDIDYDELLESLIDDTAAESEMRAEQGYGTVELVGWGSQPYYDAATKKLHWAMELNFDDAPTNTLNYNIRILGREGYLVLNAIGEMDLLPEIRSNIDPILAGVDFQDGQRYADYRPGVDRLAAYGVGGLIAGKVLAKTGVLAAIGIFLAKAWKLVVLAVIGLAAGFRKLLGRGE